MLLKITTFPDCRLEWLVVGKYSLFPKRNNFGERGVKSYWLVGAILKVETTTGSPSSLYEPHKQHNMASNYKGLYGIFYKISLEVVKSENSQ